MDTILQTYADVQAQATLWGATVTVILLLISGALRALGHSLGNRPAWTIFPESWVDFNLFGYESFDVKHFAVHAHELVFALALGTWQLPIDIWWFLGAWVLYFQWFNSLYHWFFIIPERRKWVWI